MFLYCFQLSCTCLNIVEKMCFNVVLISCDLWNFSTQKKNFPMRRFCTVNNNQFIHDLCILLFRYPPILHFIPWTWSRQPGELSKHLFPHNLQCMHCFMWIRWLKNQQPGLSLHFHGHFFSTPLLTRKNIPIAGYQPPALIENPVYKHILYMVTLWVTVFEKINR